MPGASAPPPSLPTTNPPLTDPTTDVCPLCLLSFLELVKIAAEFVTFFVLTSAYVIMYNQYLYLFNEADWFES